MRAWLSSEFMFPLINRSMAANNMNELSMCICVTCVTCGEHLVVLLLIDAYLFFLPYDVTSTEGAGGGAGGMTCARALANVCAFCPHNESRW